MLTRRLILTGLLAGLALPALAQGKKSAGGDDMTRLPGIDGAYTAAGLNADGSKYRGQVEITQQGDAVEFTWTVGTDTFRGQGTIEARVVTVDWGAATPVIYVVMDDGELHGTWDDGAALEKLTPR
ncbi:MAG: hypothetical protein QNJ16_11590 [Rhodobacter sp.]|nr:hypothetical protein [Rhodobacter sp.]